jgi:hypothetical protein
MFGHVFVKRYTRRRKWPGYAFSNKRSRVRQELIRKAAQLRRRNELEAK